jgi:hypothetical protein
VLPYFKNTVWGYSLQRPPLSLGHHSDEVVKYSSLPFMRSLPPKTTPLIGPSFRCTEVVKYGSLPFMRSLPPKTTPLIGPWFRCTEVVKYSQTCIKRSPLGQRKSGLIRQVTSKRGLIHMEFSMIGQEKCNLLIQVTA